jgi:hypothetical protein
MTLDFFKNSLKISGIFLFAHMAHSADDSFEAVAQRQQRLAEKPIQSFSPENTEVKLEGVEEKSDPTKLADEYRNIIQTQEEKPSETKALTAIKLAALLIQQGIPLNKEDEVLLKGEAERKDVINYQLILHLGILLKQKQKLKETDELYTTLIKRVITESNLDNTLIFDIVTAFEKLNHFNHAAMLCRALITINKENVWTQLMIFSINRLAELSILHCISFDKKDQALLQNLAEKGNINAIKNLALMAIWQDKPISKNIIEWLNRPENAKIKCDVEAEKYERAKQKAKEASKREEVAQELLKQELSRKKKKPITSQKETRSKIKKTKSFVIKHIQQMQEETKKAQQASAQITEYAQKAEEASRKARQALQKGDSVAAAAATREAEEFLQQSRQSHLLAQELQNKIQRNINTTAKTAEKEAIYKEQQTHIKLGTPIRVPNLPLSAELHQQAVSAEINTIRRQIQALIGEDILLSKKDGDIAYKAGLIYAGLHWPNFPNTYDDDKAFRAFQLGAELGHEDSQFEYALRLFSGTLNQQQQAKALLLSLDEKTYHTAPYLKTLKEKMQKTAQ